jgi:hypothetical protein
MTFNEVREEFERQEDIEYGTVLLTKIDYFMLEKMCIEAMEEEYGLNEKQSVYLWRNSFLGSKQKFSERIDFAQELCRILKNYPSA